MDLISGGTYDEVLPRVCLSVSTLERPVAAAVSATQTHSPTITAGSVDVLKTPHEENVCDIIWPPVNSFSESGSALVTLPLSSVGRPATAGFYKQNTAAPPSTSSSVNQFPVILIARFIFIDMFIFGLTPPSQHLGLRP